MMISQRSAKKNGMIQHLTFRFPGPEFSVHWGSTWMGQGESGFAESLIWGIFPSMMQGIYRMLVVFFLFGYVPMDLLQVFVLYLVLGVPFPWLIMVING